jgi:hypothetical protein
MKELMTQLFFFQHKITLIALTPQIERLMKKGLTEGTTDDDVKADADADDDEDEEGLNEDECESG